MKTILTIAAACIALGACGPTHAEMSAAAAQTEAAEMATGGVVNIFLTLKKICDRDRAVYFIDERGAYEARAAIAVVENAPECASLKPSVGVAPQ